MKIKTIKVESDGVNVREQSFGPAVNIAHALHGRLQEPQFRKMALMWCSHALD